MPNITTGKWKVPPEIRAFKPKGTMVKRGHDENHYYVYEHSNVKGEDGKWHTKNGRLIGYIQPGLGFIRRDDLLINQGLRTLEYGQYALGYFSSEVVRTELGLFFEPSDVAKIYSIALIMAVNGKQAIYKVPKYFEQSWLSVRYPTLKMGEDSIRQLLSDLGAKSEKPQAFQDYQLQQGSSQMIIDGHVIRNCSRENDLSAYGNKYKSLKSTQINLLTILDGKSHKPLANHFYMGNEPDKSSVKDILGRHSLKDKLFIVDKGFYSVVNMSLFSTNGNHYLIPPPKNSDSYKAVTDKMDDFHHRFVYRKGKKKSVIEYRGGTLEDGTKVYAFRDIDENMANTESYEKHLFEGQAGFSREEYDILKDFFGVIVLQTDDSTLTPQQMFETYKGRWAVETYYDFLKCEADYNAIGLTDYYEMQGYAFIILIASLIAFETDLACARQCLSNILGECFLEARAVKIHFRDGIWRVDDGLPKKLSQFMDSYNIPYDKIPTS